MSATNRLVRAAVATAGTGALVMGMAGPAAAHHCWRDWEDRAYENLAQTGTPWVPLSAYLAEGLTYEMPGVTDECLAHVPEFTVKWMDDHGLEIEPLIQVRGTVGGGAYHQKGKVPGPTHYLTDADFGELIGYVMAEPDCAPPTEE